MRRLAALLLPTVLAACGPSLKSDQPLFAAAGSQPQAGLWAVMDVDCTAPTTAAVQDWPKCAMPLWFRDGEMTVLMMSPSRSRVVFSDGAPRIAQTGDGTKESSGPQFLSGPRFPSDDREPPERGEYYYYAAETEGAPVSRVRAWELPCLGPEDAEGERCNVASAAAVREIAREVMRQPPSLVAVWVAP